MKDTPGNVFGSTKGLYSLGVGHTLPLRQSVVLLKNEAFLEREARRRHGVEVDGATWYSPTILSSPNY